MRADALSLNRERGFRVKEAITDMVTIDGRPHGRWVYRPKVDLRVFGSYPLLYLVKPAGAAGLILDCRIEETLADLVGFYVLDLVTLQRIEATQTNRRALQLIHTADTEIEIGLDAPPAVGSGLDTAHGLVISIDIF